MCVASTAHACMHTINRIRTAWHKLFIISFQQHIQLWNIRQLVIRSCEEHIFTLTSFVKIRINDNMSTFVALIDMEKAFDCIDRTLLWYRLLCNDIDWKLYKIITRMYTNATSCLKWNNIFTDWFEVTCGVRQDDNLSPTFFNSLLINDLANYIKQLNKGTKLRDLQYMLDAMNEWMSKRRLKVNINK